MRVKWCGTIVDASAQKDRRFARKSGNDPVLITLDQDLRIFPIHVPNLRLDSRGLLLIDSHLLQLGLDLGALAQ